MDFGNIQSGIKQNAQLIGTAAGLWTSSGGWGNLSDEISRAFSGQIKVPDIGAVFQSFSQKSEFKTALLAYIGGYIIKEINPPWIGQWGEAIQRLGLGYGIGTLINEFLYQSTR